MRGVNGRTLFYFFHTWIMEWKFLRIFPLDILHSGEIKLVIFRKNGARWPIFILKNLICLRENKLRLQDWKGWKFDDCSNSSIAELDIFNFLCFPKNNWVFSLVYVLGFCHYYEMPTEVNSRVTLCNCIPERPSRYSHIICLFEISS